MKGQLYGRMGRQDVRLTVKTLEVWLSSRFDSREKHTRVLLLAALASVPFGFV
jgi:hypothetical protein